MKDIPWYEWLYAVTTDGKVWSYPKYRHKIGRFLLSVNSVWYRKVTLFKRGVYAWYTIHRLVALTYIPNPENLPVVHHINGIRNDNRLENLEWRTESYNVKDWWTRWRKSAITQAQREIAKKMWIRNSIPVMQLTKEWILCRIYDSISEAERITWIFNTNISFCTRNKNRTSWWYYWRLV